MSFKPYDAVMVLSLRDGQGNHFDTKGTYLKRETMGSQKGKHKVEVNTCPIHVPLERLMDHDAYFKQYHLDKTKLPAEASGLLNFVSGDYKS